MMIIDLRGSKGALVIEEPLHKGGKKAFYVQLNGYCADALTKLIYDKDVVVEFIIDYEGIEAFGHGYLREDRIIGSHSLTLKQ